MDNKNFDIESILDRIKKTSSSKSHTELAATLKSSPQVVSTWKKRGTIPYEKIIEFAEAKDLSLDYLFYGNDISVNTDKVGMIDLDLLELIQKHLESDINDYKKINRTLYIQSLSLIYNQVVSITDPVLREHTIKTSIIIISKTINQNNIDNHIKNIDKNEEIMGKDFSNQVLEDKKNTSKQYDNKLKELGDALDMETKQKIKENNQQDISVVVINDKK
ncbi:MAG: helix-turn-helix domain-containing protein [Pseudomonadota bacterium]